MELEKNFNAVKKNIDPLGIMSSYETIYNKWLSDPEKMYMDLLEFFYLANKTNLRVYQKTLGKETEEKNFTAPEEDQFQDPLWEKNPFHHILKEYYLLNNYWLLNKINSTTNVEPMVKKRTSFWTQQMFNMLSPINSFFLNPKAIESCIESKGKSLEEGIKLFADDLSNKNISMVDGTKFEIGKNIASTSGKVVFRNKIFELIQYTPTTDKVHKTPILIVPPWINKFYVLDLNPKKSVIKYLLDQNHTVFLISWRNPPASMRNTTFTDYLMDGILKATSIVQNICNVEQMHCIGYCIGGTALGTLLAWLNSGQKEVKNPIAHITLFCSLFTFEEQGDIDVFIDESTVELIEKMMSTQGYLDGEQMGQTFRFLRSNSLIWSYFANSYLLGQKPMAFDVLFWNTDNTRIPEKLHSFYLRKFYLENSLAKKNTLEIKGQKLDLSKITQPIYSVGTEQDHITPWQGTFRSIQLTSGENRYALSTSGHIVGILNPPVNPPKRDYWVGEPVKNESPEDWLNRNEIHHGSWWEDWAKWLDSKCGPLQALPSIGNKKFPVICDAPGTYVLE